MNDESTPRQSYEPRYSRGYWQPRIRVEETEEEAPVNSKGILPLEKMTFDEMIIMGMVIGGAVAGSAFAGAVIGWFGGSLVGFKTGAWWGRRSTKSK